MATISRDAPESQKKLEIDKVIKTLREYVAERRGAVVCLVKEQVSRMQFGCINEKTATTRGDTEI